MYPSGWPDVVQIDELALRYSGNTEKILMGISAGRNAASTQDWMSVVGMALDEPSQELLVTAVRERRISGLALMVLANRMPEDALGIELIPASTLAGSVLGSWFQVASWAAKKGLRIVDMEIHELFATCYAAQADNCKEAKDLASLNRKIFGKSQPWGR